MWKRAKVQFFASVRSTQVAVNKPSIVQHLDLCVKTGSEIHDHPDETDKGEHVTFRRQPGNTSSEG
jgi:hypothetical protein